MPVPTPRAVREGSEGGGGQSYEKELGNLERLTRERVMDDPQEVRRRWWQRVRLLLPRRRRRPDSQADGAAQAA